MKKIFFTGANGFLGEHIAQALRAKNDEYEIHGYSGKIEDYQELKSSFLKHKWHYIFHFAGVSHVGDCEANPQKAYEVNALGTMFLAQLIEESNFSGKLFFPSTGMLYDLDTTKEKIEINETTKLRPRNIYGRTKYYAEQVLEGLSATSSCQVCILRLFNHTHRSQSDKFILPSVLRQINEQSKVGCVKVGNIDVVRDFSLISDFTASFYKLLEAEFASKFQIISLSSGVGRNLRDLVKLMVLKSGKNLEITMDPSLARKNDPPYIVGKFSSSYYPDLTDSQFIDAFLNG